MSGGAYDYAYMKLIDFADRLDPKGDCCNLADPELRIQFREHLKYVIDAMKAIEWNDSGDGDEDEAKYIRKCIGISGNTTDEWVVCKGDLGSDMHLRSRLSHWSGLGDGDILFSGTYDACLAHLESRDDWVARPDGEY